MIDADATKINLDELHETSDPRINALKLLMVLCVEHTLRDAPTVDAEPVRHAHWIEDEYGYMRCSECKFENDSPEYVTQFCPMCGAKMDEEAKQ